MKPRTHLDLCSSSGFRPSSWWPDAVTLGQSIMTLVLPLEDKMTVRKRNVQKVQSSRTFGCKFSLLEVPVLGAFIFKNLGHKLLRKHPDLS